MPRSAIAAGAVDHVLPPEQMPGIAASTTSGICERRRRQLARAVRSSPDDHLNELLDLLRGRTKFDFRSYKRSTLERRIGRRMGLRHVDRDRGLRATADGRAGRGRPPCSTIC